jgi:hypothetical protein
LSIAIAGRKNYGHKGIFPEIVGGFYASYLRTRLEICGKISPIPDTKIVKKSDKPKDMGKK